MEASAFAVLGDPSVFFRVFRYAQNALFERIFLGL